jgi:predicted DNA-binding transcriptional regulator AlpA
MNNKRGYPSYLIKGKDASCFLRLPQVLELIPIGKSTLWEKVKKGEFPKQIKLGPKTSVWRKSDVQAYIDNYCNDNEVSDG